MKYPVFLWLPFIHILISLNTHLISSKCLEDQRSILLQLRSNLEFNPSKSTKLATWNQTSDCCQWNGVQCDNSTGHVIGLDLCNELITSGIDNSSSLFDLEFLESLNLANNSFNNAQIPSEIGTLSGLIYLNLSNAGFSGQVPMEISRLTKLVILDLSSLCYLGFSPLKLENPSLGKLIEHLTNIRELYLNGVVISANGSKWGKALSSSLLNLQVLSLSNCSLSGEIDSSLEKLHSLSVIVLDQNNLASPVPEFIANFRNLTLLKLSNCDLKGTFPQKIFNMPTLRSLDLSYNELLQGSLPSFQVASFLQELVISHTNFSGLLPKSVGNLKQLQRIELANCGFTGSIPTSMVTLKKLVYLDFSFNKFSGTIPSFSLAKNLTYLQLSYNMLTGTLASTNWEDLTNLVNLDLGFNSLNGSIPMSLFSLSSLQKMQLNQNRFSGQLKEFSNISSSILDTLDLSSNILEGPVPKSLLGLKDLKVLNLSFNNFNGSLKLNMIKQLKNLTTLELSYNSLSVDANDTSVNVSSFPQLSTLKLGSCNLLVLPDFLRNQSRLQSLDLSSNHIQGTIPNWIWTVGSGYLSYFNLSNNNFVGLERPLPDTPFLSFLDIHSNKIQGEIPTLSSSSAIYLDYSNNSFTSISPDIGNDLLYAVFLSMSTNNIHGDIPTGLCNATTLQVLDLSYNYLNGTIPECVIKMTRTLGVLNLRGNSLMGTIFNAFPKDCSLSSLDISENSLDGQVPISLSKCKLLEVLDLGRNQLQDTFPCWLKNFSNLRVLVMRANKFHGSIECPPSNISWPVLQIIDLASNHFSGELNAQCFLGLSALMAGGNNFQSENTQLQYPLIDNICYQDMVVVTFKGTEIGLLRILTLFRSMDFSNNTFHGEIPQVIGNFNALIALNLSYNVLSGSIPSSVGNLSMLESLDLSHNHLSGSIPKQLANLDFLEVLDLSFNKLVGTIPEGNQLQTFDQSSYIGNKGLCGSPLPKCSSANNTPRSITPSVGEQKSSYLMGLNWQFILMGSGFGTGAGLVISPLMFWKKGRIWYDEQIDNFVSAILLAFGIGYTLLDEGKLGSEEGIGYQLFDINCYDDDDDDDEKPEERGDYSRFCVICSKLDIERRRVIHNPTCTCHG